MAWFGKLLYLVERHATRVQGGSGVRPKMGRPRTADRQRQMEREAAAAAAAGRRSRGDPDDEGQLPSRRQSSQAVQQARARLQREVAIRRAALVAADVSAEPGLRYWLAKQRWLWRRRRLPGEQVLMLQLAGADMNTFTAAEWQTAAHAAAHLLAGSDIELVLPSAAAEPPAARQLDGVQQQQQQQSGGEPAVATRPVGSERMRVARWVETQQALFADGRLTDAQLRYLSFLGALPCVMAACVILHLCLDANWLATSDVPAGITWVLSEQVTDMPAAAWQERYVRLGAMLAAGGPSDAVSPECQEWLDHQRGLHALGWLARARAQALGALGVSLTFARLPEQQLWDLRLSELLAFKAEHGHCEVPAGQGRLGAWLEEQRAAMQAGQLERGRATQLRAIGVAGRVPARMPAPAA